MMSRSPIRVIAMAGGLLAAGALLLWEETARRETAMEVERLRGSLEEKERSVADLEKKLEEAKRSAAGADGSSGMNLLSALLGAGAGQGGAQAGAQAGPDRAEKDGGLGKLMEGFMGKAFSEQIEKQLVGQRLSEIEHAVALSPAERAEIEALLRKEAGESWEVGRKAMSGGKLDIEGMADERATTEEDLRRILGSSRYEDYTAERDRLQKEQQESTFQSQFSFFSGQVKLRPDQLPAVEAAARKYGIGSPWMPGGGEEGAEWMQDLLGEGGGSISTQQIVSRMTERGKSRLAGLSEEMRGLLDPDQLEKFERWKQSQTNQMDLVERFMPSFQIPAPETR